MLDLSFLEDLLGGYHSQHTNIGEEGTQHSAGQLAEQLQRQLKAVVHRTASEFPENL